MKLTIEHLAPYLPYGLRAENNEYKHDRFKMLSPYDFLDENGSIKIDIDHIKPILRPLSDLKSDELKDTPPKGMNVNYLYYHQFEYLVSNHFDVFGLIEQGLAIDFNTL